MTCVCAPVSGECGRRAVVELSPRPLRRRVARDAILRKAGRGVVGIGRLLIIRQMTRRTSGGKARVYARRMTLSTRGLHVRPGQREMGRRGVIERGPRPLRRRVAQDAILREAGRGVVGIGRLLVVRQVAGRALGRSGGVCTRRVTLGARGLCVRAGQREAGPAVIERSARPLRRRVACGAILREACCAVIGIGRLLIVRQVAGRALRRGPGVLSVQVALGACGLNVRAGQLEPRQAVIELRPLPVRSVVATGTIRRELAGGMVRVLHRLIVRNVAAIAIPARRRERRRLCGMRCNRDGCAPP